MKKTQKLSAALGFLLVAIAISSMLAPRVQAAGEATIAISPVSISTSTGVDFSVDVVINPLAHYVTNADLYLTYDQTKFTLTSITASSAFSTPLGQSVPVPANGTASYSASTTFGAHISTSTTYATLNFHSVANASNSPITITNSTMVYADNSPTYPADAGSNVVGTRTSGAVTITSSGADVTAPTVTGFAIPATATSLTVPITTFTATDATGVTGYLVTETASTPAAGASGWIVSAPTTYTFSSAGTKTLYAWAKDAAGNVSSSLNDTVIITISSPIDTTAPVLSNLAPSGELSSDTTSATLSLSTDENATCKYALTANISYISMSDAFTTTGEKNHAKTITGLRAGTSYAYFVRCQDALGNTNMEDHQIAFSIKEDSSDDNNSDKQKVSARTISVSKKKISRGQTLIERGAHFSKNSTVSAYFSKAGGGYYAPSKIKTSSAGKFSISYKIPANKPSGTYSWYAVDDKTGKTSKTRRFVVK